MPAGKDTRPYNCLQTILQLNCLQAMAVKEVARFRVKKHLTFNYPTVAKTLRDAFDKGGEKREPQHMCGMMAMQMQGGLGHDDLNQGRENVVSFSANITHLMSWNYNG